LYILKARQFGMYIQQVLFDIGSIFFIIGS
jgi:hypothetical protein